MISTLKKYIDTSSSKYHKHVHYTIVQWLHTIVTVQKLPFYVDRLLNILTQDKLNETEIKLLQFYGNASFEDLNYSLNTIFIKKSLQFYWTRISANMTEYDIELRNRITFWLKQFPRIQVLPRYVTYLIATLLVGI